MSRHRNKSQSACKGDVYASTTFTFREWISALLGKGVVGCFHRFLALRGLFPRSGVSNVSSQQGGARQLLLHLVNHASWLTNPSSSLPGEIRASFFGPETGPWCHTCPPPPGHAICWSLCSESLSTQAPDSSCHFWKSKD